MKNRLISIVICVIYLSFFDVFSAQIAMPISKIDSSMNIQPKPVLLMLSTDWCAYCKLQVKQINKNRYIQSHSSQFYFTVFDAESVESVTFQGIKFAGHSEKKINKLNELARYLLKDGRAAYPVWILLDEDYQELFRHEGFLKSNQINSLVDTITALKKK